MTQVKEVISVQPRLVVLTFHLSGFLLWQTSFVNPCHLTYHVEFRRLADYDSASADWLSCQHTPAQVLVRSSIVSSAGIQFHVCKSLLNARKKNTFYLKPNYLGGTDSKLQSVVPSSNFNRSTFCIVWGL